MSIKRISVFGDRDVSKEEEEKVLSVWKSVTKGEPVIYLHGGSKGIQSILQDFIKKEGLSNIITIRPLSSIDRGIPFDTKWLFRRNLHILENSDIVLIFDLKNTNKYEWTISYCESKDIPLILIKNNGENND